MSSLILKSVIRIGSKPFHRKEKLCHIPENCIEIIMYYGRKMLQTQKQLESFLSSNSVSLHIGTTGFFNGLIRWQKLA